MNAKEQVRKQMREYGHSPTSLTRRSGTRHVYDGACRHAGCELKVELNTENVIRDNNVTTHIPIYYTRKALQHYVPLHCPSK